MRPTTATQPVFHLTRRPSTVYSGVDMHLSVDYSASEGLPTPETLSVKVTCTNGSLPDRLKAGDVTIHSKGCPEFVTFKNLIPPSPGLTSQVGKKLLWRLLSHLSIGFQSLEDLNTLKSLLALYNFPDTPDQTTMANEKRIEGIKAIHSKAIERLVSGIVMRGREVTLDVREDHFAGPGDMFLFGSVLDTLFANYASINSFTRFKVKELSGGIETLWPARVGKKRLV